MSDNPYSEPVAQLLTLGEPDIDNWLDYESLGIHAEHIPGQALRAERPAGAGEPRHA